MSLPGSGPLAFTRNVLICYLLRAVDRQWHDLTISQLATWSRLSRKAILRHLRMMKLSWSWLQPKVIQVVDDDETKSLVPAVGEMVQALVRNDPRPRNADGKFCRMAMGHSGRADGSQYPTTRETRRTTRLTSLTTSQNQAIETCPFLSSSQSTFGTAKETMDGLKPVASVQDRLDDSSLSSETYQREGKEGQSKVSPEGTPDEPQEAEEGGSDEPCLDFKGCRQRSQS
jgi:hypothetical protein